MPADPPVTAATDPSQSYNYSYNYGYGADQMYYPGFTGYGTAATVPATSGAEPNTATQYYGGHMLPPATYNKDSYTQ